MVGEISMYCFLILLITGVYLALYYTPSSSADVVYHPTGASRLHATQRASTCPRPTQSVLNISFNTRAGLVMRQIHHWAAVVFLAADGLPPVPHLLLGCVPEAP